MATNIIICGAAGRMGKMLVRLIHEHSDAQLVGAIEADNHPALGKDAGEEAGVEWLGVPITSDYAAVANPDTTTLDFTLADVAMGHLRTAVEKGAGIAVGTTGLSAEQRAEAERIAPQSRVIIAPNMSVGVNVLMKVVADAAKIVGEDFDPEVVEMHHRFKIDAPSGTALALGRIVAEAQGKDFDQSATYGRQGITGQRTDEEIGMMTLRGGDTVGEHTVYFAGFGERLELTHRALNRECLARGAVRAALWLADKPNGLYSMKDVLGL